MSAHHHPNAPAAALRQAIARKIGLLLLIPALGSLLALAAFYLHFAEASAAPAFINVAGRQRMLSEQILHLAGLVQRDPAGPARTELRAAADAFGAALEVLEHGGTSNGHRLSPAPRELQDELASIRRLWHAHAGQIRRILTDPPASDRFQDAYRRMLDRGPALTRAAERLVAAYEAQSTRRQRRMLSLLGAVAALGLASLALGVAAIRRYTAERREIEEALWASQEKYRVLMENASDAILLAGLDGRLLDANRRATELLGYTRQELLHLTAEDIHPPQERAKVRAALRRAAEQDSVLSERLVLAKDGAAIPVEVACSRINLDGEPILQGIFRDIRQRRRTERERLARERAQHDALVREVHHRIKNNLQGVIGLLRNEVEEHPKLRPLIERAIARVRSVALVHGLQSTQSRTEIVLAEMLAVIGEMVTDLTGSAIHTRITTGQGPPLSVRDEEAVPLALVINELLVNAVKHGGRGPVEVWLSCADLTARLTITSPGASLPPGFDFDAGAGLRTGLGLVKSLLPHEGAALGFEQTPRGVAATLILRPPAVGGAEGAEDVLRSPAA